MTIRSNVGFPTVAASESNFPRAVRARHFWHFSGELYAHTKVFLHRCTSNSRISLGRRKRFRIAMRPLVNDSHVCLSLLIGFGALTDCETLRTIELHYQSRISDESHFTCHLSKYLRHRRATRFLHLTTSWLCKLALQIAQLNRLWGWQRAT